MRYVPERLLGRGGMGEVWQARDTVLGRTVALKRLLQAEDGPRFKREAEIAARLAHPNIAAVYEAGDDFIAMQFVDGKPLDRVPLDARGAAGAVRDAALAVHYAHEHGVIHRDLKPGNLLLDAEGRVFVLDFGLARVVKEASTLTMSGDIVGTPAYMAPEQATGLGCDARSDIYALGATLYHLLAGRPPFLGENVYAILEDVVSREPEPPPGPRDLAVIVMKALEKDARRRYPTAAALAEDLGRFLAGDPVAARPVSWAYRLWRKVRKRPAVAILAALLALAVPGTLAVRHAQERAEADRKVRQAEALLAEGETIDRLVAAEALFRQAGHPRRDEVNRRLGLLALERGDWALARMAFQQCDDADGLALTVEREHAEARRRAARLEEMIADLRRTDRVSPLEDYVFEALRYDDEQTVRILAGALEDAEGEDLLKFCFRVLGRLDRDSAVAPLAARMERIADPLLAVECGRALCHTRRAAAGAALEDARVRFGPNSEVWRQIRPLLARIPAAGGLEPRTAGEFARRAELRYDRGDLDGSIADYSRALELDPSNAGVLGNRGNARRDQGDLPGAIEDFAGAMRLDPGNPIPWASHAEALLESGDLDGAIDGFTQAIALDPDFEQAFSNRGLAWLRKKDHRQAVADFTRAIELAPSRILAWTNRGRALRELGDLEGALFDLARAIELDPADDTAMHERGLVRFDRREFGLAIADFTRAIEARPGNADAWRDRGIAFHEWGRHDRAIADFDRALQLLPEWAAALVDRGIAWFLRRDLDRAYADFTRALEIDGRHVHATFNLALVWMERGDAARAIGLFTRVIELAPGDAGAFAARGRLHLDLGDLENAIADYGRTIELDGRDPQSWFYRGLARRKGGDDAGAIGDYTRALELNPRLAEAWANRGNARYDCGDLGGAVSDWERFLALAPDHPSAPSIRGSLQRALGSLAP